jgi:hypothetical protein
MIPSFNDLSSFELSALSLELYVNGQLFYGGHPFFEMSKSQA